MEDIYYALFRDGKLVQHASDTSTTFITVSSYITPKHGPCLYTTFEQAKLHARWGDSILKVRLDTIEAFTDGRGPA